jgi:hypothetical protein
MKAAPLALSFFYFGLAAIVIYFSAEPMSVIPVVLFATVALGTQVVVGFVPGARPGPARATWPCIISVLVMASVLTEWPVKAAFLISRPSLERAAHELAGGQPIATPAWVGVIRVRKVITLASGVIGFETSQGNVFVSPPSAAPLFNVWSVVPLSQRWAYVATD